MARKVGKKARLVVTRHITALHNWPDAPEHRRYLRIPHMHEFAVTIEYEVGHDDRETEFHDLGDQLMEWLREMSVPAAPGATLRSFGQRSCEMIAREILARETAVRAVKVAEDDSHAAVVARSVQ